MTSARRDEVMGHRATPARRPPPAGAGPLAWVRANLFSSPLNAALTLVGVWITWTAAYAIVDWALVRAVFTGSDGSACAKEEQVLAGRSSPQSSTSSSTVAIRRPSGGVPI